MLEGLLGLFSSGDSALRKRKYGPVVYVNKGTFSGMRGYVVRSSPSDRGAFYPSANEAGADVAKRYADGRAAVVSTLEIPFGVEKLSASDVDRILLECKLETGSRPSLSSELKKQIGLKSEHAISVGKLQSARS